MRLLQYPLLLIVVFVLFLLPINAHEYWIQPAKYFAAAGETIELSFMVGEHFKGERWGGGGRRINSINYFHHGTVENITRNISNRDSSIYATLTTGKSGTHAISLATNNSYIELEAEKFNAYLLEDGLDHIVSWRASKNSSRQKSREYYRRCAKTFIQVGSTKDVGYKGASAMILEIIAHENPYNQKPGVPLKYQVLYKNKPLHNGLVRFWYKDPTGKVTEDQARTNDKGEVNFVMKKKGEYMVSVVWMEPWLDDDKADFISTWGSLTFAR